MIECQHKDDVLGPTIVLRSVENRASNDSAAVSVSLVRPRHVRPAYSMRVSTHGL